MTREPLKSSNIFATGHDETGMEVQFHAKGCKPGPGGDCNCGGGDVWHYPDVSEHVHAALRASPSPAGYFHRAIKMARTPDLQPRYYGRKVS